MKNLYIYCKYICVCTYAKAIYSYCYRLNIRAEVILNLLKENPNHLLPQFQALKNIKIKQFIRSGMLGGTYQRVPQLPPPNGTKLRGKPWEFALNCPCKRFAEKSSLFPFKNFGYKERVKKQRQNWKEQRLKGFGRTDLIYTLVSLYTQQRNNRNPVSAVGKKESLLPWNGKKEEGEERN